VGSCECGNEPSGSGAMELVCSIGFGVHGHGPAICVPFAHSLVWTCDVLAMGTLAIG
jgi:hypothetical protein